MPESSADTFWGKGFLAIALGTASPDRKKTHKGQKNYFIILWQSPQHLYKEKEPSVHLMQTGSVQYGFLTFSLDFFQEQCPSMKQLWPSRQG